MSSSTWRPASVLLAALAARPGDLPRAPHPHRPVAALLPEAGRVARSLARVGADAPRVPRCQFTADSESTKQSLIAARHRPGAHPHHRARHRPGRREHSGAALGRTAVPLPGSPGSPQARRARARHVGEGAPRDRRQARDRRRGARARAARAARRPRRRVHRLRQRGGAPGLARPRVVPRAHDDARRLGHDGHGGRGAWRAVDRARCRRPARLDPRRPDRRAREVDRRVRRAAGSTSRSTRRAGSVTRVPARYGRPSTTGIRPSPRSPSSSTTPCSGAVADERRRAASCRPCGEHRRPRVQRGPPAPRRSPEAGRRRARPRARAGLRRRRQHRRHRASSPAPRSSRCRTPA